MTREGTPPRRLSLWRASIWHPDAIPVIEGQLSFDLKRRVLPALDGVFILMGIIGVVVGMPTFDIIHNEVLSGVAAWALTLGGASALIGVSFPRLWRMEALGKVAVSVVLGGYATGLWVLAFQGDTPRALTAGAYTGLLIPALWTLARLGRERRGRRSSRSTKVTS